MLDIPNILKSDSITNTNEHVSNLNYFLQKSKSNTFILKMFLDKLNEIKSNDLSESSINAYNDMYSIFYDRIKSSFNEMEQFFGTAISSEENSFCEPFASVESEIKESVIAPSSEVIQTPVIPSIQIIEGIKKDSIQTIEPVKVENSTNELSVVNESTCVIEPEEPNTTIISANVDDITENTLVISEISGKVILPYTLIELNKILENNPTRYTCIKDIINLLYTKSIKLYKNATTSRFKEAFKLIKEREKGSLFEALDLAFELAPNSNLHPAIISACKNIDQLDVYLSCLEYNELKDFRYFKIIFNSAPSVIKSVKKILNNKNSRTKKILE